MLKKLQLFRSVTAIGIVIGAISNPLAQVRANPSLPNETPQSNVDSRSVVSTPATNSKPTPSNNPAPNNPPAANNPTPTNSAPIKPAPVAYSPKIDTVSGEAETALAEYLAASDVKFYGAYWCPHCQKQKVLFQRQLCKDKNIQLFPTWVVNGKSYPGIKDLKEIAAMTGYKGPTNFQYHK
jgi:thiol-disulfide isomerase/thioredoxin